MFVKIPQIIHGFSLRYKYDYNNDILSKAYAAKQLALYLNIDQKTIIYLNQNHNKDNIIITTSNYRTVQQKKADALITSCINKCMVIFTADCLPIIVYDRKVHIISILHAGWRGTSLKITQHTLGKMITEFGCNPEDIILGFGPCIDQCCYKVDASVLEIFKNQVEQGKNFFTKCGDKYMLNLKKANKHQALLMGIPSKNIAINPLCTYCYPHLFFSYRRDGKKTGRMINFIMLKN